MTLHAKTMEFKKSDWLRRSIAIKTQEAQGWKVTGIEEYKRVSKGSFAILFIIFPPLALLSKTNYVKVYLEK